MKLSVIIPMLNEQEIASKTYARLSNVLKAYPHELIFIDDGSSDQTLEILKECIETDPGPLKRNRVISFSRNFGHQAAFSAGIEEAQGDCTVIIDGDLQDPPELILEMIKKWEEGYQVVYAQRRKREGESLFKLVTAKVFYRILNSLTSIAIPTDTGDFRLMDSQVVNHLRQLPERSRFLRGLVCWVGFKHIGIQYDRAQREYGETKYPLKKMFGLARDGITSFSTLPLTLATYLGVIVSIIGALLGTWAVIEKIFFPETTIQGWSSLLIVIVFMGGIQLITIGIVGEYLGRIYEEVKGRPLYIINQKIEKKTK
jgi:polyisoprenyl-phosphate glycosyltransferase